MSVLGKVIVPLMLNGLKVDTAAMISNEVSGLVIGVQWMQQYSVAIRFGEGDVEIMGMRFPLGCLIGDFHGSGNIFNDVQNQHQPISTPSVRVELESAATSGGASSLSRLSKHKCNGRQKCKEGINSPAIIDVSVKLCSEVSMREKILNMIDNGGDVVTDSSEQSCIILFSSNEESELELSSVGSKLHEVCVEPDDEDMIYEGLIE